MTLREDTSFHMMLHADAESLTFDASPTGLLVRQWDGDQCITQGSVDIPWELFDRARELQKIKVSQQFEATIEELARLEEHEED